MLRKQHAFLSVDDSLSMQNAHTHELYLKDEVFFICDTLEMILYQAIKTKKKEIDFPKNVNEVYFKLKI